MTKIVMLVITLFWMNDSATRYELVIIEGMPYCEQVSKPLAKKTVAQQILLANAPVSNFEIDCVTKEVKKEASGAI